MDFLATKGIEYLLVLGYLALLVPFWRLLSRGLAARPGPAPALVGAPGRAWFAVADGFHYHPGHTWARPEGSGLLRVGMDDFAHRLVGPPQGLELPPAGQLLTAGEPGWRVRVEGKSLPLLSPVTGRVEAVNARAVRDPEIAAESPYEDGWLMKVRVPSVGAALKSLLPDRLARAWTEDASEEISSLMGRELGVVLADGGMPVSGLARELAGEAWPELVARLLLTDPLEPEALAEETV